MFSNLYSFRLYIKKLPILLMVGTTLLMHIFMWFWLLWNIRPQEDSIFLHYTVLFGVDFSGPWHYILYLPIIGLVIFIINTLLGWILYQKDHLASYLLQAAAVFVHIFLVIVTLLLVFLNV
ncbi:MAG: hypothetical protein HOE80_00245 [Candidatus Magasanikbacteria bacterium]|jgi:hypothetical protein|nr:hypothetical protein [Candidatus Magasanikbacteria bacterium]MBT4071142.1 hypothetical protein [Candidatus Magasanikbacteria bacterium]